jgi:hypothetical protein
MELSEKNFWMVFKDGCGSIFKRHESEESAVQEATRLAQKENVRFYILKTVGEVVPVVSFLYGKLREVK